MKGKLYIKAASLIETVMAITIITLCSLVGTMVYSSVVNSTPPMVRYSYEAAREQSIEKIINGEELKTGIQHLENFSIENILKKNTKYGTTAVEIIIKTSKDTMKTPSFYIKTDD